MGPAPPRWHPPTSWSSLLSSVFLLILLRSSGSMPELAGLNSPSVSLESESLSPGEECGEDRLLRWLQPNIC